MNLSNIYKKILVVIALFIAVFFIWYYNLTNRHKAIVKTFVLHHTGIVNKNWNVTLEPFVFKMMSPTFLIDGIYKSMEGPKASRYIQLNDKKELYWITGFSVEALDAKTNKTLPNDFICHTNIDISEVNYYTDFKLQDRIGKQYPRLTSLSNGFESYKYPKGYGIPVYGNSFLMVTTQTLNHNIKDILKKVKHRVNINYEKNSGEIKPLMSQTIYIQLPFGKENIDKSPLDVPANQCVPIETKNHTYINSEGTMFSGHWKIPIGKSSYKSTVSHQLQIKDSLRLHFAAIHVHPFASKIYLYDKTNNKIIFENNIKNYSNKIGLIEVPAFTSKEGVWLYAKNTYELVLDTNNTSNQEQDMMGSMFLFFYDKELDTILKEKI